MKILSKNVEQPWRSHPAPYVRTNAPVVVLTASLEHFFSLLDVHKRRDR